MSGSTHSSKQQWLTWTDYWYLITVNLMLAAPHGTLLPESPRRVGTTAMDICKTASMCWTLSYTPQLIYSFLI
jgi:hypothetical protein